MRMIQIIYRLLSCKVIVSSITFVYPGVKNPIEPPIPSLYFPGIILMEITELELNKWSQLQGHLSSIHIMNRNHLKRLSELYVMVGDGHSFFFVLKPKVIFWALKA